MRLATPRELLVGKSQHAKQRSIAEEEATLFRREASNLERQYRVAEKSYAADHLDLVVARGYVAKLLRSARVVRFLAQNFREILAEFEKLARAENDAQTAAGPSVAKPGASAPKEPALEPLPMLPTDPPQTMQQR
jgi:RepB plasmid partitioning protein